ncbi:hypothetical protein [Ralstonia pseudosolanacearum]
MDDHVWDRNIMAAGWFHIRPIDSATPLAATTNSLGLSTWQSPGHGYQGQQRQHAVAHVHARLRRLKVDPVVFGLNLGDQF